MSFLLREDLGEPVIEVLGPAACTGPLTLRATGRHPTLGATQQWEAHLPAPCPPDTPLVLSLAYAGGSPTRGRWLHLGPEGSYSSSLVSPWLPLFGYPKAIGTLRYRAPTTTVVKATGRLASAERHGEETVVTFVAERPSVLDFAAGPYTVVDRRQGRIPVSLYLLGRFAPAEQLVARTAAMVDVLEEEFGPYPYGEAAIVEAPTEPGLLAGFEALANDGFLLVRSDYFRADPDDVWWVAHELAHLWFPYVVGSADGTGGAFMLDEALAHYGRLCAMEVLEGPAAAERFRRECGLDAARLAAAGYDHRLSAPPVTEGWDRVGYQFSDAKGHLVYDMLSRLIGRDRFRTALHRITREYAGQDIEWETFLASIETDAGQPLGWFYEQWLDRPGLPVLSLTWDQTGDTVTCVITQSGSSFRLDVPVQVEFTDGTALVHLVRLEADTTGVDIPVRAPVHTVRLDPQYTTLHATPEQWAEAEARGHVTRGRMAWDDDDLEAALAVFREGLDHLPESDPYGIEFLLRLHIGWLHQEKGQLDEAMAEYELALTDAVRPADHLARLYLNIATICDGRGDRARARWAAENVLRAEQALGKPSDMGTRARDLLSRLSEDTAS